MTTTNAAPQPDGRWPILACSSSCGAAIVWARTLDGKHMPVDAAPHPDGKWRLLDEGAPEPRAVYAPKHAPTIAEQLAGATVELHHSHFATCSHAAQFRTGRQR